MNLRRIWKAIIHGKEREIPPPMTEDVRLEHERQIIEARKAAAKLWGEEYGQ